MSDLERNLRAMLAQRADSTPTNPGDWQDLTVRMARRNRRARRVMAGALAVVLIVGPLAGFAVARAVEDSEPSGQVTAGGRSNSMSTGQVATAEGADHSITAAAEFAIGGIPLEKLFRRGTGGDVAIRAFISRYSVVGTACQGDGWCPPVDCYPDGAVVGQLSTEAAVGIAGGAHYRALTTDLKVTGGGAFGANGEDSPARWVIAQTSDRVAKVRVSFEGGGDDEMAPVDGIVVLAALTDPQKTGGTVEALDSSGSTIDSADAASWPVGSIYSPLAVGSTFGINTYSSHSRAAVSGGSGSASASSSSSAAASSSSSWSDSTATTTAPPDAANPQTKVAPGFEVRTECTPPPPTLPAPGEQPVDPAAARAEIERAFAIALDGGYSNEEEKRAVVEDSDGLDGVMDEIRSGAYAQQVKDASGKATEIVFTSPTEAAVRYDINVANYSDFPGRIGKALLIDGRWKIARVTVCADISLAGVSCPEK